MRARVVVLAAAMLIPVRAEGQAPPPLDKAELIRLLTNPLFAQTEVADVVRRSCLTFRPTERDWADLRSAGAGGEVIASAAACDSRRAAPPVVAASEETVPAISAVAQPAEVITTAGTAATVRVRLSRGRTPVKRTTLALSGTTSLGLSRDISAVTDDSGIAVFRLPAVARVGTHQFEIRTVSGTTFPGKPAVLYAVRSARPGRVRLAPDFVDFGRTGDSAATVVATVTDSLGNAIGGEPVEMNGGIGAPLVAVTDSAGRATFTVAPNAVVRGSVAQIRVRGLAAVELEIAAPAGLSGVNTGFQPITTTHAAVGSALGEPLVFKARTVQGTAPTGRTVRFHALNARVTPESAVLDSSGRLAVDVVLGVRAGEAAVFASIDSVERIMSLRADPGPIDTLILEHNGESVNGRSIVVTVGKVFTLRLRAHDLYGNETSMDALAPALRVSQQRLSGKQQDLQLVNLDASDSGGGGGGSGGVLFTLKAQRAGTYNFAIGSGIKAVVRIDAIP
ncbi:MAG TPA: Ig-like domain-containing protein [Gemmatimonadales bacterium]|nr:Ig-like domain-containing protein [Gemmatimonadales bacterium]